MITTMALGFVAMLQAGIPVAIAQVEQEATAESSEVGFDQLSAGDNEAAIEHLHELLEAEPGDPALLINLGAAYVREGQYERAAQSYQAAIESSDRYELELADGRWMDSRLAARRALEAVEGRQLAAR